MRMRMRGFGIEIRILAVDGKRLVLGPVSGMLADVVLVIVLGAEGGLEVFDVLGGPPLRPNLLLAAELLAEAAGDGGDGVGVRVAGDGTQTVLKGVAGLERRVALCPRHGGRRQAEGSDRRGGGGGVCDGVELEKHATS